jgi:hypothetical protein
MPEFEETNAQPNPAHSYSPSTDAAKKPRTRRRSGGFKTEVSASGNGNIGEVNPADALKQEKLSGSPRRQGERSERRDSDEAPRAARTPRERATRPNESSEPRAPRKDRSAREPREERVTNPQPSDATLAAIQRVEAQLAERRAARDTRRAEREKNRPAPTERKSDSSSKARKPKSKRKPAAKVGLLGKIGNFIGKLIGIELEAKPSRERNSEGRKNPRSKRDGQARSEGRRSDQKRQGGRRSSQGRRSGQSRRSGNQKPHSAKSLSNES